jgi:uncharacterized membrane protein YciS (DUF1049 family)
MPEGVAWTVTFVAGFIVGFVAAVWFVVECKLAQRAVKRTVDWMEERNR